MVLFSYVSEEFSLTVKYGCQIYHSIVGRYITVPIGARYITV